MGCTDLHYDVRQDEVLSEWLAFLLRTLPSYLPAK